MSIAIGLDDGTILDLKGRYDSSTWFSMSKDVDFLTATGSSTIERVYLKFENVRRVFPVPDHVTWEGDDARFILRHIDVLKDL